MKNKKNEIIDEKVSMESNEISSDEIELFLNSLSEDSVKKLAFLSIHHLVEVKDMSLDEISEIIKYLF
jgi:hypothetical protein